MSLICSLSNCIVHVNRYKKSVSVWYPLLKLSNLWDVGGSIDTIIV